jgi:hypothetical protein
MTSVETWNDFAKIADPIIAFAQLITGLGLLAVQKRMAATLESGVTSGELSREEAAKNAKLIRICAFGLTGCGAFLVVMWLLGF